MTFITKGRAALVAVVLGATALTGAAPAQAQSFEFSFGTGGGGVHYNDGYSNRCYGNRQIRRDLRARGYNDIDIRGGGRYVRVRASRNGNDYRITYDACRGRIVDRDRL